MLPHIFVCIGFNILLTHFRLYQDGACLQLQGMKASTPQAQSYDIPSAVTLFWQRAKAFILRWIALYMSSIWQGNFNYLFEICDVTRPGIESGTSQTRCEWSTTGLSVLVRCYLTILNNPLMICLHNSLFLCLANTYFMWNVRKIN